MTSLNYMSYRNPLLKTKRGNRNGAFSNAKPFSVIAIIDAIEDEVLIGNKIRFDNPYLEEKYKKL